MKKVCLVLSGMLLFLLIVGAAMSFFSRMQEGEKIGIIRVEGAITSSDDIITTLKQFSEDPAIKAIVMRVDSPGG